MPVLHYFIALFAVLLSANGAFADDTRLHEHMRKSLAFIEVAGGFDERGLPVIEHGTGLYIDQRYVITAAHVLLRVSENAVEGSYQINVRRGQFWGEPNTVSSNQVMFTDPDMDIAVLKVSSEAEPFPTPCISSNVGDHRLSRSILSSGFPLGDRYQVGRGYIGSLDSKDSLHGFSIDISSGQSGSPVYDETGLVLGLAVGSDEGAGIDGQHFYRPLFQLWNRISPFIAQQESCEGVSINGDNSPSVSEIDTSDITSLRNVISDLLEKNEDFGNITVEDGMVAVNKFAKGGLATNAEILDYLRWYKGEVEQFEVRFSGVSLEVQNRLREEIARDIQDGLFESAVQKIERVASGSSFNVGSFNLKNFIGPDKEYFPFEQYTPEEFAWKLDWTAGQLIHMNADIVAFQDIYDEESLVEIVNATNQLAAGRNEAFIPDRSARYSRKAIFRRLYFEEYGEHIYFAENLLDTNETRRSGTALVSRFPFLAPPSVVQDFSSDPAVVGAFAGNQGKDQTGIVVDSLSYPAIKAQILVEGRPISVLAVQLPSNYFGSKINEEDRDVLTASHEARAMGLLRAQLQRSAEIILLRRIVLEELAKGEPLIVIGDFSVGTNADSLRPLLGERPFRNYTWMRRHNATSLGDRYSNPENDIIQSRLNWAAMYPAQYVLDDSSNLPPSHTARDGYGYSIEDTALVSRHFHPDEERAYAEVGYFRTFDDHLVGPSDGAPYNKLVSDKGQTVIFFRWKDPFDD